jgi:hypothetical protein
MFDIAERYIQLRRKWAPVSWGDLMMRINEMVITPLICIFFVLMGRRDPMMVLSACLTTYRAWSEWIEYHHLRHSVQRMFLICKAVGGPFIVTNDSEYLPYVFADAVLRVKHGMLHPRSATAPPKEAPETHRA